MHAGASSTQTNTPPGSNDNASHEPPRFLDLPLRRRERTTRTDLRRLRPRTPPDPIPTRRPHDLPTRSHTPASQRLLPHRPRIPDYPTHLPRRLPLLPETPALGRRLRYLQTTRRQTRTRLHVRALHTRRAHIRPLAHQHARTTAHHRTHVRATHLTPPRTHTTPHPIDSQNNRTPRARMIAIPRRYERAFRDRYKDLLSAYDLPTANDRAEAKFAAAQWVAWLEARQALTVAMDNPDMPNLNTTERKELRALRRHCFVMSRAYQNSMQRLAGAIRRIVVEAPASGEQLGQERAAKRQAAGGAR